MDSMIDIDLDVKTKSWRCFLKYILNSFLVIISLVRVAGPPWPFARKSSDANNVRWAPYAPGPDSISNPATQAGTAP